MLGLLNTVLTRGGSLLTYVKEGLVMANRFLTPPKLTFPAQGSAEFDPTSYDQITTSAIPMPSSGSLLFWYNLTNYYPNGDVFSTGAPADDFRIRVNDACGFYLGADYRIYTNGMWNTSGQWDHFALTWDSSGSKVYFLGSQTGLKLAAPTSYASTPTTSVIGAKMDLTYYFEGNLANVAIWNRALSSDEINSVMWKSYDALSGAESNGLQAWYSLDDITSPAASLANMEQLAADKDATIENKAAITAAINALS
jgi:hypothetical protein